MHKAGFNKKWSVLVLFVKMCRFVKNPIENFIKTIPFQRNKKISIPKTSYSIFICDGYGNLLTTAIYQTV